MCVSNSVYVCPPVCLSVSECTYVCKCMCMSVYPSLNGTK